MGLPPFVAGAVNLTVAMALPAVAVTALGAPGVVAGLTLFERVDGGPFPIPLTARTVNL
jgi:hypothetical protein